MHNYTPANSIRQKKANWGTINNRILSHFGLDLPAIIITGLCHGTPGLIEVLLYNLRLKIDEQIEVQKKFQDSLYLEDHSLMSIDSTRSLKPITTLNSVTKRAGRFSQKGMRRTVPRLEF
ncbi:unnamed protein product [Didymodactylos carnosus]|nr:unnamed protein product [Didymodactylos carnosus]CAF3770911.1 unnamed protein product [Didymodactylos carnosus]